MNLSITLKEALLGFSKTISHLDGHDVEISSKKITKPEQVLTGRGVVRCGAVRCGVGWGGVGWGGVG